MAHQYQSTSRRSTQPTSSVGLPSFNAEMNMAVERYSGYKIPHMLYDGMVCSRWHVLCFNLLVKLKVGWWLLCFSKQFRLMEVVGTQMAMEGSSP